MNVGGLLWPQNTSPQPQLCPPACGDPIPPTKFTSCPGTPPSLGQEPSLWYGWAALTNPPSSGTSLRAQEGCSPLWEGLGTQPPRTTFCPWENEVPSKGPPTNLNESRVKSFPRAPEHIPKVAGVTPGWLSISMGVLWWLSLKSGGCQEI